MPVKPSLYDEIILVFEAFGRWKCFNPRATNLLVAFVTDQPL